MIADALRAALARRRPRLEAGRLATVEIPCPICQRASQIEGVPEAWTWRPGCGRFSCHFQPIVLDALTGWLAESGLAACPQCNRLMPHACGARCPACGFKLSCSAEP